MNARAHPSTELLAGYANGALPLAPGLVVAAHVERCARCRKRISLFEAVAGEMLASLPPAKLAAGTLRDTIQRLDDAQAPQRRQPRRPPLPHLPTAVAAAGVRPRLWFGGGRWVAGVRAPRVDGWRVFLLYGPAGARMPLHSHAGPEFTCVLSGAYRDGETVRRAGDFSEASHDVRHRIEVTDEGPCLSLIARRGPARAGLMTTLASRLLGL